MPEKHGHAQRGGITPEYFSWAGMKSRCLSPHNTSFSNYGGRGITICEEWTDSFETFLADMGPRPPGSTLDRIDNEGNYEPSNCKWSNRLEQAFNKRTTGVRQTKEVLNAIENKSVIAKGKISTPHKRKSQVPEEDRILSMKVSRGSETHTLLEWAALLGLGITTIYWRVREGYKDADIIRPAKPILIMSQDGTLHTIKEWARIYNISERTILKKHKMEMPIEEIAASTYRHPMYEIRANQKTGASLNEMN